MEKQIAEKPQEETTRRFDREEWETIGDGLQNFHSIFSKFWSMGKPQFTRKVGTLAVYFDKLGDLIEFNINPEFWDTCTDEQKVFFICHEVTHVLFYHGFRINCLKTQKDLQIANLALDIVVNHFLTDNLGFTRELVDPEDKLCWVDTVFPDVKKRPMAGKHFEYYYNLIQQEIEQNGQKSKASGMSSIDEHESLESFIDKNFEEKMKESLDRTDQEAIDQSPEMKEMARGELDKANKGGKEAGPTSGNSWLLARTKKVIPKRKWETVIKNWASKYLEEKVMEQWTKEHRRLVNMPKDFLIPAEHEVEEYEKKRIPVWFFQDTSGSCAHLADRFFAAAESLPEDRFIVKMHCFDTRVFETDLKSKKLYGFGGTSFTCIENYIQNELKKNAKLRYPEACFIITDGYGDRVTPEKANRWFWFLSEKYTECIPKECKTFDLKDFE